MSRDSPSISSLEHSRAAAVGIYLTDEIFLYRVAGFIAAAGRRLVELEDCYGLDLVRVPVERVHARRLRIVNPGDAHAPGRGA